MTTVAYSSTMSYNAVSDFRVWTLELHNALIAAGLVQHTDTGQMNFATVSPSLSTNAVGGYTIYRFNDPLQATAPIYIKIEWGFPNNSTTPGIWITVGTATNGAGTITGVSTVRSTPVVGNSINSFVRPLLTNVCVQDGYVAVIHKRFATANGNIDVNFAFVLSRTVDDAGALTNEGFRLVLSNTNGSSPAVACCVRFANSYVSAFSQYWMQKQGAVTTSYQGSGLVTVYKGVGVMPRQYIDPFIVGYNLAEIIDNTTFPFAAVGGVTRTYLAVGKNFAYIGLGGTNGIDGFAIAWS